VIPDFYLGHSCWLLAVLHQTFIGKFGWIFHEKFNLAWLGLDVIRFCQWFGSASVSGMTLKDSFRCWIGEMVVPCGEYKTSVLRLFCFHHSPGGSSVLSRGLSSVSTGFEVSSNIYLIVLTFGGRFSRIFLRLCYLYWADCSFSIISSFL